MKDQFIGIKTEKELIQFIEKKEEKYTRIVIDKINRNSGLIKELFRIPNSVKEVWDGKMGIDPRNELASWGPVIEILFQGILHRAFLDFDLTVFPIGSDFQFSTDEEIIHIDLKTHREGDADLDRAQDIRPEQISGCGDYKEYFKDLIPKKDVFIENLNGVLGDTEPKLPPYYEIDKKIKLCISLFIVCIYEINIQTKERIITRVQIFCVPNGIIRYLSDYRDCFQVGKDGRRSHRYRVNLINLKKHEKWRWVEIKIK